MKETILIIAAILLTFISSEIHACEPCAKILNFEETIQRADLIIVGKKISEGPLAGPENFQVGPDWIEFKIMDVLKGESRKKIIKINSWNGMCPFGIQIDSGNHMLFLTSLENAVDAVQYDTVNFGCSVKTYPIEGEIVVFGDEKISMEKFTEILNEALKKE